MKLQGKAHVFGADVDTDAIIPARHLNVSDPELLAAHCMENIDPEFRERVNKGDVILATTNFGCGSSREHAPVALSEAGVQAVVALSYARIFFRNAIDGGYFPPVECTEDLTGLMATGDEAILNLDEGTLTHLSSNAVFQMRDMGAAGEIICAGGLFAYARRHGLVGNQAP